MTAEHTLPEADTPSPPDATAPPTPLPAWLCVLLGVACALLGLLPWLVTGLRLPLQNLWATSTLPGDMPIVLLPFSQYEIVLIVALFTTGSATAGMVARAVRGRMPRLGATAVFAGLVVVQLVAIVQTSVVVAGGLQQRREAILYLGLLVGLSVTALLGGILVFWLVAKAPRAGALVGLAMAAVLAGASVGGLLVPVGTVAADGMIPVLAALRWVAPVLVGVAIAWCGIGTAGRVVAALFAVALVWVVPALTTAIFNAAGSRVLAHDPAEMLAYGALVFRSALLMPELALPPVVVTVVVAALGITAKEIARRVSSARTA